ncbi:hypothetical protein Patl1_24480 [Pistacia atlantica]|uniref:Uncharacterized protein n=1 Tax=Pistacia atlantica TaxID=434234 RepID=A0ACC0ZY17_9ROSI|nr:hypothetical protein Patl1_24480 [Pistacia atlantica]
MIGPGKCFLWDDISSIHNNCPMNWYWSSIKASWL